jgi:hypothetical protein
VLAARPPPPHDHGHVLGVLRQVGGRLPGGVARADHVDLLAAHRRGLGDAAPVEHARADQRFDSRDGQPLVAGSGRQHHRPARGLPCAGDSRTWAKCGTRGLRSSACTTPPWHPTVFGTRLSRISYLDEAQDASRTALAIARRMAEADPSTAEAHRDLSVSTRVHSPTR